MMATMNITEIVGIQQLWAETLGHSDVCLALLDGLVDQTHPSLWSAKLTKVETLVVEKDLPRWKRMRNQLRITFVVHQMLSLPHRLKVVGVVVKDSMPVNHESAHRPFWARLLAQTMTVEEGVTKANGTVTADSMHLGNSSDLLMIAEDVPMHHLFLLDMKIGR